MLCTALAWVPVAVFLTMVPAVADVNCVETPETVTSPELEDTFCWAFVLALDVLMKEAFRAVTVWVDRPPRAINTSPAFDARFCWALEFTPLAAWVTIDVVKVADWVEAPSMMI